MKKNHVNRVLTCHALKKAFRIMRIGLFLFLVSVFQTVGSVGYSQSTKITLKSEALSLVDVLSKIEDQSEYRFIYDESQIDLDRKAQVDFEEVTVKEVLEELFVKNGVDYQMVGTQVILRNSRSYLLQQQRTISGKVTDDSEPLSGVTVLIKGTIQGAITDFDGNYSISNVPATGTLVFSFVGMLTQEVDVGNQTTINISMKVDAIGIQEVVAIGYDRKVSKEALTGSVSKIKSDVVLDRVTPSLTTSLQGLAAGLTVTNNSPAPGASASILIRNVSSWQGGSDPLFVIDGVISTAEDFSRLNPNDIDNLSILKDAASAAIYGMRAGNGVILVTTKIGTSKETKMTYQASYTSQSPTQVTERIPTMYETAILNNLAFENIGEDETHPSYYTSDELDYFKTHNFDPLEDIWGDPGMKNHNLTFSGGNEKTNYYLSGSYLDQDGATRNYNYQKYSLLAKLSGEIREGLTFDLTLNMAWNKTQQPFNPYDDQNQSVLFGWAIATPRTTSFYIDGLPVGNTHYGNNLAGMVNGDGGFVNSKSNMVKPIIKLKYEIPGVKGLSVKGIFSINNTYDYSKRFATTPINYIFEKTGTHNHIYTNNVLRQEPDAGFKNGIGGVDNALRINTSRYNSYDAQALINYDRAFGEHNLSAMAGYQETSTSGDYLNAWAQKFVNTNYQEINGGDADDKYAQPEGDQINLSGQASYFGRLDYNFAHKYLLGVTFRADGTYIFPPDARWGYFPAVSAGWNIHREEFFKPLTKYIDALKLRGSYGLTGSSATDPWQWQQNYGYNPDINYILDGVPSPGISLAGVVNSNITWEKNKNLDIGMDLSIFDGLGNLTVDYWHKKTTDILAPRSASTPNTVGASLPAVNYGEAAARGFELSVGHRNSIGEFKYGISANFSISSNEYLLIDQAQTVRDHQNLIGRPINGLIYGYESEGIIRTQADVDRILADNGQDFTIFGYAPQPGMLMYTDLRGPLGQDDPDGKIDGNDLGYISENGVPRINYGFNLNTEWKGFSMNAQFAGLAKYAGMVDPFHGRRPYSIFGVWFDMWSDFWTPENTDAPMPDPTRHSWIQGNNIEQVSTFWLQDRSFLRLKYLNFNYALPSHWLQKTPIKEASFFVAGENLITFSKYYLDPEQNGMRQIPVMKSYTAGLEITF